MFSYQSLPFGRFTQHLLEDEQSKTRMNVTPDGCATLLDLSFGGRPVLDSYVLPESLAHNAWFKNVPLFPFPNRLRDGAYEWEGKTYHFSINDSATTTALHGLSREFAAVVERLDHHGDEALITCRYQSGGDHRSYPFLFTFEITYRLSGADRFEAEMSFRNDGDTPIPVGLGWHPYYRLTDRVDDLQLQLPPCEMIGIDRRMLPTGKRYDFNEFTKSKALESTVLDNCFALKNTGEGRAEFLLAGDGGRLRLWQETGPGKFNYFQVFTHPDRVSLAIEPMTCNVDAFHNGDGLITLEPGETTKAKFGMVWEG